MTTPEPESDPLARQAIARWSEGLRRGETKDADAALVRRHVLNHAVADDALPTDAAADRATADRLLELLNQQGWQTPPGAGAVTKGPTSRWWALLGASPAWRWGALATVLVTATLVTMLANQQPELDSTYPEPPIYRGRLNASTQTSPQPRASAEALAAALRARGVGASLYAERGRSMVDFEVTPANQEALAGLPGLTTPLAPGQHRVTFERH